MKTNEIMKFKTKPKFIDANQFDGSYKCMEQLKVLFPKIKTLTASYHEERNEVGHWQIETLSGCAMVKPTDWVCLSENGIFVVNDSTLHQLYEPF